MKNKKVLWPWAKRYVMGTSEIHPQDSSETEIKEDAKLPYDSSPIEINEWFHTFMYMNIPIAGWFYLKKLARQPEHNKLQDFARAYLYYKMVFLAISLVIVILLLIIGIFSINRLFAYMELL